VVARLPSRYSLRSRDVPERCSNQRIVTVTAAALDSPLGGWLQTVHDGRASTGRSGHRAADLKSLPCSPLFAIRVDARVRDVPIFLALNQESLSNLADRCLGTTVAVMGRKCRFGRLASRTRAARNPTVEEPLEHLRDEVARQDEHSHVDARCASGSRRLCWRLRTSGSRRRRGGWWSGCRRKSSSSASPIGSTLGQRSRPSARRPAQASVSPDMKPDWRR
jgi:hypothetical protein